ncbi:unnamed protein product [Durusdinium trenchii]|uniref:Uncharacterized protein n=1 Tax=Durusdinium trenchii TaxID=1381693 RepID=A0ABP0R1Z9_9DINO
MEALEPGEAIEGIEAIDGQELQFFLIDEILIHMPVTLSCTEDFFYEEDDLELLEKPRDAVAAQQQHDHGQRSEALGPVASPKRPRWSVSVQRLDVVVKGGPEESINTLKRRSAWSDRAWSCLGACIASPRSVRAYTGRCRSCPKAGGPLAWRGEKSIAFPRSLGRTRSAGRGSGQQPRKRSKKLKHRKLCLFIFLFIKYII